MTAALSPRDEQLLKDTFPDPRDYAQAVRRLQDREPLAYVLGEWYFYDETYRVSPACLVPRPETEHLVEELIKRLPQGAIFADLCTGSGCIAISILAHRPDCRAVAVDLSEEALALAKENAALNGVSDRITFLHADVLSGNALGNASFDAIVSNPPYIVTEVIDTLEPEVLCEPRIALDGGADGLLFYRVLVSDYRKNVKENGFLLFEIGYDQGEALKALCPCEIKRDYSGNDRVALYYPNTCEVLYE
jgi:release factor glutamine methyltransferase